MEAVAMSKCFAVKFPSDFDRAERERLTARLDAQSFMPLTTYSDEFQSEFLFVDDTLTAETLRKLFEIPAAVEVIDTSHWRH